VNVPLQFLTVTDSRCVRKPFGASQEAPANIDENEQQQKNWLTMHAAKNTPHVNKGQVAAFALCTAAPQKQKKVRNGCCT